MLDTVVMSDDDVCCSVVCCTLVGVFVFSVMWSELLITSAISCPLWSLVYECQRVECAFTSPVRTECGMFVMYCGDGGGMVVVSAGHVGCTRGSGMECGACDEMSWGSV